MNIDSLELVRLSANIVIVIANITISWMLYGLYRSKHLELPAPRLVALLATLIFLCGVTHLGLIVVGQPPARVFPTALKLIAAVFWIATAMRLPVVATRVTARAPSEGSHSAGSHDRAMKGLLVKAEQLRVKTQMLETFIHTEAWLLDKTDTLQELGLILADLEAELCKI
jgi:hypothetical protein